MAFMEAFWVSVSGRMRSSNLNCQPVTFLVAQIGPYFPAIPVRLPFLNSVLGDNLFFQF